VVLKKKVWEPLLYSIKIGIHLKIKIDYIPEKIIISEIPVLVEPRFDFRVFRVIVLTPGRRTLRSRRRQGSDPNQFSATTGLCSHSQVLPGVSSGQPCNKKIHQRKYNHNISIIYVYEWCARKTHNMPKTELFFMHSICICTI